MATDIRQDIQSPGFPGLSFPGVGTGLCVLRDGQLLLLRRRKAPEAGHWNIPGGKIDHMERSAEAACRETLEECGIRVEDPVFLCHSEQILPEDGQHWVSLIYVATRFSGEARMAEPDKFHEIGWFALDALPEPLSVFARDAVAALVEKSSS